MRLSLSPVALGLAIAGLAVADWGSQVAGGSLVPGGPLDETAHLLTVLLVLWALGRHACERFLMPALIASVAVDVDHIPGRFGVDWLTAGTPRPYIHSMLTIALVLVLALVLRRWRAALLGIAIGLTLHLWRDLAELGSGVPLLWPFSYRSFTLPFASYAVPLIAVVAIDAFRLRPRPVVGAKPAQSQNERIRQLGIQGENDRVPSVHRGIRERLRPGFRKGSGA